MDNETIEGYLIRSGVDYESVGDNMWVVNDEDENVENIVITHAPPMLLFRVKLMELPAEEPAQTSLFRRLLELNATEMINGAYGLEQAAIVANETLQSENLDYNEFQAALDGLTLAITEHYQDLKSFHARHVASEAEPTTTTAE